MVAISPCTKQQYLSATYANMHNTLTEASIARTNTASTRRNESRCFSTWRVTEFLSRSNRQTSPPANNLLLGWGWTLSPWRKKSMENPLWWDVLTWILARGKRIFESGTLENTFDVGYPMIIYSLQQVDMISHVWWSRSHIWILKS
jgi:hypothetical protein